MEEIDIWQRAKLLIEQHGENADLEAAKHVIIAIERGNTRAEAMWKRIGQAIVELQRQSPRDSDAMH